MSIVTVVILVLLLLIIVWRELEVQNLHRQNNSLQKDLTEARQKLAAPRNQAAPGDPKRAGPAHAGTG